MSDVKARMRRVLDVKIRQLDVRLADNGDAARHAVENDDVDRGAALQRHLLAFLILLSAVNQYQLLESNNLLEH